MSNYTVTYGTRYLHTAVRFDAKVGQIDTKWDKTWTFEENISASAISGLATKWVRSHSP